MIDWLKTVPEVANVSYGTAPMMGTWTPPIFIHRPGALEGSIEARTLAGYASDNYLNTLGIPLLRGRNFTSMNRPTAHTWRSSASRRRGFHGTTPECASARAGSRNGLSAGNRPTTSTSAVRAGCPA